MDGSQGNADDDRIRADGHELRQEGHVEHADFRIEKICQGTRIEDNRTVRIGVLGAGGRDARGALVRVGCEYA